MDLIYWTFCHNSSNRLGFGYNKNFMVTPDVHWFGICGMYKHHVVYANTLTLHHLKQYMKWASNRARSIERDIGSSWRSILNFNAGKILLILEGIFGLSYSVVDDCLSWQNICRMSGIIWRRMPITEDGNIDTC